MFSLIILFLFTLSFLQISLILSFTPLYSFSLSCSVSLIIITLSLLSFALSFFHLISEPLYYSFMPSISFNVFYLFSFNLSLVLFFFFPFPFHFVPLSSFISLSPSFSSFVFSLTLILPLYPFSSLLFFSPILFVFYFLPFSPFFFLFSLRTSTFLLFQSHSSY